MKKGWLVNDILTCIPGTKTFWHDLLEWLPELEDKCNGYTPYNILPYNIERDWINGGNVDYIIRNASYFRPMNVQVKTISLLQDLLPNNDEQLSVCNKSDIVVFNSPYTQAHYIDKITTKTVMIPLGVDFNKFIPIEKTYNDELNILEKKYVDLYNTFNSDLGLNLKDGGGSVGKHSEETKNKIRISLKKKSKEISQRMIGEKNHRFGKKKSELQKEIIKEYLKKYNTKEIREI
jgi:hypothetical protein